MRRINKPNFGINDIFKRHRQHFINKINKSHAELGHQGVLNWLNNVEDYLSDREADYQRLGEKTLLTNIEACKENRYFNISEIKESYNYIYSSNQFFRNQITNIANGRCPICDSTLGYGMPELDHILPKHSFCDYAITPINLVPICTSCNRAKGTRFGNDNEGILTPYYNNYPLNKLIQFEIAIEKENVTAKVLLITEGDFRDLLRYAKLDNEQITSMYTKIKYHFSLYKLNLTLGTKAEVILDSTIYEIASILDNSDIQCQELESYLLSLKNKNDQEYVNDEYIKNALICAITQHKDKTIIYEIIKNKIMDKKASRKSSLELHSAFYI